MSSVICAHYLTAGIQFKWEPKFNTYLADDPQWLIVLYKWISEWIEKIKETLLRCGLWDRTGFRLTCGRRSAFLVTICSFGCPGVLPKSSIPIFSVSWRVREHLGRHGGT